VRKPKHGNGSQVSSVIDSRRQPASVKDRKLSDERNPRGRVRIDTDCDQNARESTIAVAIKNEGDFGSTFDFLMACILLELPT